MSTQVFGNAAPIFRVRDIAASLRFYVDILGFTEVSWGNADFTRVDRDRCSIFLCRDGQGLGRAWAWIGVTDTAALHEQLIARNIAIRMPPTNYFYALEMHLEDPDGNVLRLGSDPLTDQPFSEYVFPQ